MSDVEKIIDAFRSHPELKEGVRVAIELLGATVSGNSQRVNGSCESWGELDEAFENIRLEQEKLGLLEKLFRLALSAAVHAVTKRR